MLFKRPVSALIAACVHACFAGTLVFAADLTIVRAAAPPLAPKQPRQATGQKDKRTDKKQSATKEGNHKKNLVAKTAHAKRLKDSQRSEKAAYNFYRDPTLKLRGGATRKIKLEAAIRDTGLGTGLGYNIAAGAAPAPVTQPLNTSQRTAYRAQTDNSAGIAFNCREKSSDQHLARREVTACFVHKHDKSWKTQTYLTKGISEEGSGWGGGLAIGYAY